MTPRRTDSTAKANGVNELPAELQRRSIQLEWIRKAKAELEAEAAAAKAAQLNEEAEAAEQTQKHLRPVAISSAA